MTDRTQRDLVDKCPAAELLRRVAEGVATAAEEDGVAQHLDGCEVCRRRMEGITGVAGGATAFRNAWSSVAEPGPTASGSGGSLAGAGEVAESAEGVPQLEGYRIEGRLGEGGMGTVWRAEQLSTKRAVALKFMSAGRFGSPKARMRFEREVELSARLEHPNIARIYDSGLQQGVYYYAMECIEGSHLDVFVRQHALIHRHILALMIRVCRAVQFAHQRGVIHRDLKPSNIMVTGDAQPRVLDFGLARSMWQEDAALNVSMDGEVAGTPAYMSPEQAAGKIDQIDTRSDVYTLGVILFELLTGELPRDMGGGRYAVMRRIVEEDVRRPRQVNPRIDSELESLLLKSLARDAKDRYASAGELAADIRNYLAGDPLTARPATTAYFLRKRLRKHRVPLAIAASILAVLLSMVVLYQIRLKTEKDRAQAGEAKATAAAEKEHQARKEAETEKRTALLENYYNAVVLAQKKIAENDFNAAKLLLARTLPESRGWEWGHLMHLCGVEKTLLNHQQSDSIFALAPDGRRLQYRGRIWDIETGKELTALRLKGFAGRIGPREEASQMWLVENTAFAPDGRRLLVVGRSSGGRVIGVWDSATGEELLRLYPGFGEDVAYSPTFSSDGLLAFVAFHNRQQDVSAARLWDARTGVELPPLRLFKGSPPGDIVAISPDCRKAIVSQGQAIETAFLWDLDKGEEIPCPQNSLDSPPDAGLRPPGTGERTNGTPTTNEGMKLIPLAISPDGRLAVGKSRLATPVVWEIASGKIIVSPARPCYLVRCPVFAPDSRKLFFVRLLGNERTDELWDLGRGGKQLVLEGHIGGDVVSAAFSADGRLLITGGGYSDRSVRIWDAETGKSRAIFKDLRSKIPQVALGYDGGRAVVGVEGCPLSIWDVARTEPVSVGWVPPGAPPAFSPDGKSILVAKDNSTVAALDARDGHLLSNLAVGIDLQQYGIAALAFGPARKCAVCRPVGDSKNRLLVVDLDSGRKQALPEHENGRVILSDDGHYLAVCGTVHQQSGIYVGDGSARIWDTETGELKGTCSHSEINHTDYPATFSPDGRRFAMMGHAILWIWEVPSGQIISKIPVGAGVLRAVAMDAHGETVLTCGPGSEVRVFDVKSGTEIGGRAVLDAGLTSATLSPDGRRIVTAGTDIRIWETVSGRELLTIASSITTTHSAMPFVRFSPDGESLMVKIPAGHSVWHAVPWAEDAPGRDDASGPVPTAKGDSRRTARGLPCAQPSNATSGPDYALGPRYPASKPAGPTGPNYPTSRPTYPTSRPAYPSPRGGAWVTTAPAELPDPQAFANAMARAKQLVQGIVARAEQVTPAQRRRLAAGLRAVYDALDARAGDAEALALCKQIEARLGLRVGTDWPFDAAEAAQRQADAAAALGLNKEAVIDLGNRATMKLVLIPPGKFVATAPDFYAGPSRVVTRDVSLRQAFFMATTPVTQEQYRSVAGENPSRFRGDVNPVESISYDDAVRFARQLSIKSGQRLRLPAPDEWEYACRAGAAAQFYFGDDSTMAMDYAWVRENSGMQTHPVAQKKPNAWGLYDMLGNVLNGCGRPRLGPSYPANPYGWLPVVCGFPFEAPAAHVRLMQIPGMVPIPPYVIGFRVVMDLPAEASATQPDGP